RLPLGGVSPLGASRDGGRLPLGGRLVTVGVSSCLASPYIWRLLMGRLVTLGVSTMLDVSGTFPHLDVSPAGRPYRSDYSNPCSIVPSSANQTSRSSSGPSRDRKSTRLNSSHV